MCLQESEVKLCAFFVAYRWLCSRITITTTEIAEKYNFSDEDLARLALLTKRHNQQRLFSKRNISRDAAELELH